VDAVGLPTRNTELARDRRSAQTLADESHDFLALDEPLAAGVNALLLGMAMPSACRLRRRFVKNSTKTPSMSKNDMAVVVDASMGCSTALSSTDQLPGKLLTPMYGLSQIADFEMPRKRRG
jgi:hypothetical protein